MELDHYARLKVSRDAPLEVIRAAYRALAAKHHPDRHGQSEGANTDMAALNGAYEVLCDAATRAAYDATLDDPFSGIDPAAEARESRAARRAARAERPVPQPSAVDDTEMLSRYVDDLPDINWAALTERPAPNPWTTRQRLIPIGVAVGALVIGLTVWWSLRISDEMAAERVLASHYEAQAVSAGSATNPSTALAAAAPARTAASRGLVPPPLAVPGVHQPAMAHPLDGGEPLVLKTETVLVDPLAASQP